MKSSMHIAKSLVADGQLQIPCSRVSHTESILCNNPTAGDPGTVWEQHLQDIYSLVMAFLFNLKVELIKKRTLPNLLLTLMNRVQMGGWVDFRKIFPVVAFLGSLWPVFSPFFCFDTLMPPVSRTWRMSQLFNTYLILFRAFGNYCVELIEKSGFAFCSVCTLPLCNLKQFRRLDCFLGLNFQGCVIS